MHSCQYFYKLLLNQHLEDYAASVMARYIWNVHVSVQKLIF